MATFYDKASIVLKPSGRAANELYVQKPYTNPLTFLDFARTSTRTERQEDGTIASLATGVPAISFPSSGGCCGLSLEPSRTNLLLRSEEFGNASWTKTDVTVSANVTEAPDGATTADKLVESATTNTHVLTVSGLYTIGQQVALSVFVKDAGDGRFLEIRPNGLGTGRAYLVFNPATGAITDSGGSILNTTNVAELSNGWYRVSIIFTSDGPGGVWIGLANSSTGEAQSYAGDGTSGVYLWGAQLEAGSYPTSYIPTTSSTATRAAESVSKTGIASLLGDSEGTIYLEGSVFDADGAGFGISLSDGTLINRVFIGKNSSVSPIRAIVTVGGFAQFDNTGSNWVDNTDIKIALKYAANDFALWVNGVEVATDISGSTFTDGTLTRFGFDSSGLALFYGNVKQLAIWDSALTDAELTTLTSYKSYEIMAASLGYTID